MYLEKRKLNGQQHNVVGEEQQGDCICKLVDNTCICLLVDCRSSEEASGCH